MSILSLFSDHASDLDYYSEYTVDLESSYSESLVSIDLESTYVESIISEAVIDSAAFPEILPFVVVPAILYEAYHLWQTRKSVPPTKAAVPKPTSVNRPGLSLDPSVPFVEPLYPGWLLRPTRRRRRR